MDAAHARETRREQDDLSERDRQILDFEKSWWRYDGSKEEAVRELFGLSATYRFDFTLE